MKYLAILKDSLREAIDSKVFYVMVGLSLLLTLVALSLSFTPKPATELWEGMAEPLNGDMSDLRPEALERTFSRMKKEGLSERFETVSEEPLNGEPEGPKSQYSVLLRERFLDPEKAAQVRASPNRTLERIKGQFANLGDIKIVEVTDVRLARPDHPGLPKEASANDVYFELTTKPTPTTLRWWPHEIGLFFGALPLGTAPLGLLLLVLLSAVVNGIGAWVTVLVSVIITAFFIPNMLRKGTVDLLLVKPIQRWLLLVYKYVGGLVFIFLNTTVAVVGVWLALGIKSGLWANYFLLSIFVITFFFAILYAVSTLFAVLTRSAVAAILLTCLVWFLLFVIGTTYRVFDEQRKEEARRNVPADQRWGDNTFGKVVSAIHFVTPRTKDLDRLMDRLLINDLLAANQLNLAKVDPVSISWGESLTVSGMFIAVMLGISCFWFATRDY